MMKLILSFWGILEAKSGDFRPMCMGMEAPVQAEKKDTVSGLTLLMISINTVYCGAKIRSCKKMKPSQNILSRDFSIYIQDEFVGHYHFTGKGAPSSRTNIELDSHLFPHTVKNFNYKKKDISRVLEW